MTAVQRGGAGGGAASNTGAMNRAPTLFSTHTHAPSLDNVRAQWAAPRRLIH
jgi:hypothetical protein